MTEQSLSLTGSKTAFDPRESLGLSLNFQKLFAPKYSASSLIIITNVNGDLFKTCYFLIKEEGLGLGKFSQGFRIHKHHINLMGIISQPERESICPRFGPLLREVETSKDLPGDHPQWARREKTRDIGIKSQGTTKQACGPGCWSSVPVQVHWPAEVSDSWMKLGGQYLRARQRVSYCNIDLAHPIHTEDLFLHSRNI